MCIISCTLRLMVCENYRPQVTQLNGFTHIGVLTRILRVLETVNDLPHNIQVNGFTPVCVLSCNSMNVILGLCNNYSGTVATFQVFFACTRNLSKTSRLLRQAAMGKPRDKARPNRARISIGLPYIHGTSEKLARISRAHDVGVYHRPINTIRSLLVHPKDKTPDLQKCGVVYQITCPQCQHLYVGKPAEPWQPE